MNDLLGRPIKKGDIVLISGSIYLIVSSHSRTIKYKGRTDHVMSTHMSEKVLILTDTTEAINNVLFESEEYINELTAQTKAEEEKILTVEEVLAKKTENAEKLRLKKLTMPGSIIIDNNNVCYIYLGVTSNDNKTIHNYMRLGWRTNRTVESAWQVIEDMSETSYWPYLETRASLKQPAIISNDYIIRIKTKFASIPLDRITNMNYLDNINRIKSILNV